MPQNKDHEEEITEIARTKHPMIFKTLAHGQSGETVYVRRLAGHSTLVERLRELGFREGRPVTIFQKTPFGDPLVVGIGNSTYALRRQEASCIIL